MNTWILDSYYLLKIKSNILYNKYFIKVLILNLFT